MLLFGIVGQCIKMSSDECVTGCGKFRMGRDPDEGLCWCCSIWVTGLPCTRATHDGFSPTGRDWKEFEATIRNEPCADKCCCERKLDASSRRG